MDWQFIITLVNSFVLIVTLVILIIQTRIFRKQTVILQKQTKEALDASSSLSLTQLWEMEFKADDMFLEKPHLRKYFYEGATIDENNPLYAEVEAAAEKLLDVIEHLLWQATLFPKLYIHDDPDGKIKWDIWHKYIIDLFISSPLLIAYAKKRRTWYTPQVIESLERAQHILNQRNNTSSA
jgi:hypothetical protein